MRHSAGVISEPGARTSWTSRLLLAASVGGLSACILFVDAGTDLGGTCHLRGEGTACGACISTRCRAQLDACCGDGDCAPILNTLDSCVGDYSQPACALVSTKLPVVTSAMDRVRDCAADCAATCNATSGSSSGASGASSGGTYATSCSSFIQSECDCSGNLAPNGVTCSSDSIGAGVCCADYGWPNKGLSCTCKAYRCKDTADGCTCGTSTSGPNQTCDGVHCCIFEGWCSCGPKPCDNVSKPVGSCTKATATCPSGRAVTSCSLRPGEMLPPVDGGPG